MTHGLKKAPIDLILYRNVIRDSIRYFRSTIGDHDLPKQSLKSLHHPEHHHDSGWCFFLLALFLDLHKVVWKNDKHIPQMVVCWWFPMVESMKDTFIFQKVNCDPRGKKDHGNKNLAQIFDVTVSGPYAPCMEYLPTFTTNLDQM